MSNSGVISEQWAQQLMDDYKIFRSVAHDLQLQNRPVRLMQSELAEERQLVIQQWHYFFGKQKQGD